MAIVYETKYDGSEEVPIQVWVAQDIDTTSDEWAAHLKSPINDLRAKNSDIDHTWRVTTTIVNHGLDGWELLVMGSKVSLTAVVASEVKTVNEVVYKGPSPATG